MISCLIVDDEQHCADTLVAMIRARFSDRLTVLGNTTDSRKAAALIAMHQPQLVFMDVEMPHISGIQLMHAFVKRNFVVVFTTAHHQYALQALKSEAVDYLLKPINIDELGDAIDKAAIRLDQMKLPAYKKVPASHNKLLLPTSKGLLAACIRDIIRIEADSNYCHFHLRDKPMVTVAKTLKEYEELLESAGFFRIHQSHLVNMHEVEYFHPGLEEYVILSNGHQVEVSRRRKAEFLQKLSGL